MCTSAETEEQDMEIWRKGDEEGVELRI